MTPNQPHSRTPRTDAYQKERELCGHNYQAWGDFARQLERQLTHSREREEVMRRAIESCIEQIEHLEWLRAHDCGPTPATLTEDVIANARKASPAATDTTGEGP